MQCEQCRGSGTDDSRDEYGERDTCAACGGLGREPTLAEALARLEKADLRLEEELGGVARELRGALARLGEALRGPDWIRFERDADGLDVLR